ncbi:NECA1 protein, partial [Zosterops hypoxanthus]|nr:NECA1 protein [Zosterops hypoxanthus]
SDDGKLSFAEFRAYFADRVLSGEELHELFHTIGTHNTEPFVGDMVFCLLSDYFSKHLGVYENVLSVLEDLNITILKAMEKTKKVSKNCDIFFTLYILFTMVTFSTVQSLIMCIFRCIKGNSNLCCSQRSQLPLDEENVENYPYSFTLSKTNKQNNMLTQTHFIWTAQTVVQCWIEEDSQWMIQINRLQKLIDRLEKKDLNLEPLKEEVLEENARSHIMIIQHQMSVVEEKVEEFHLALKQYLETASAQGGCLHVSIQKLPSNFHFFVYEFWGNSNAWN